MSRYILCIVIQPKNIARILDDHIAQAWSDRYRYTETEIEGGSS